MPDFCSRVAPVEPAAFSTEATQLFLTPTASGPASSSISGITLTYLPTQIIPTSAISQSTSTQGGPTSAAAGSPKESHGTPTDTIVGACLGAFAGLILISMIVFCYCLKKRRRGIRHGVLQAPPLQYVPHDYTTAVEASDLSTHGVEGTYGINEKADGAGVKKRKRRTFRQLFLDSTITVRND